MDSIIQQQFDAVLREFKAKGENINDPVAKLMITALVYQSQKIKDEIDILPERITERLCSTFVPKNKIDAIPSICFVRPSLKVRKDSQAHLINADASFSYKFSNKLTLSYYPLYDTTILPVESIYTLTPNILRAEKEETMVQFGKKGQVWLGLKTSAEIENFQYVSFFIRNSGGRQPEKILVGNDDVSLNFTTANRMDELKLRYPFDSCQMTPDFIELCRIWRRYLSGGGEGQLVYITDDRRDRDLFKGRAYPKIFQQFLESNDLDRFDSNIVWILFDFGPEYDVPEDIEILPNVVPVVNVMLNSVNLTNSAPVARLTKGDGSFFVSVLETAKAEQKQGFGVIQDEYKLRDFDTQTYNPALLYRDIRNLYNRFVEDYHAFIDYHGIRDGETLQNLRELVNKLGKSVLESDEIRKGYEGGTFAMRNLRSNHHNNIIKVNFLTTFGKLGNSITPGMIMEPVKDPAMEKDVVVITNGNGGEDKVSPDMMYELLRYYTLTSDRLYTRMDVDAFVRMSLFKEFGNVEMKRISYSVTIQGNGGQTSLRRGLYIDISFRDRKNYDKAKAENLDENIRAKIEDISCISLPITVSLINSEVTQEED